MMDSKKLYTIQCDLSDLKKLNKVLNNIKMKKSNIYKSIKCVINNAAIQGPIGSINEYSFEDYVQCMNVNFHAPVLITKTFRDALEKTDGCCINVLGGGAAFAQPFYSAYSCSKVALARFTETMSLEDKTNNISYFSVTPGFLNTDIHNTTLDIGKERAREFYDFVLEKNKTEISMDKIVLFFRRLTEKKYKKFSGRFFSAAHDSLEDKNLLDILKDDSDIFAVRRIDNFNYFKKKK